MPEASKGMDLGWFCFQPSGSSGLAGIGWDFFRAILIYSFVFQFFYGASQSWEKTSWDGR